MYLIIVQNKWSEELHKKKSIEVFKDFSLLTLDVMLQTAFSYKSHCQSEELVILSTVAICVCVCIILCVSVYVCTYLCICVPTYVHTYVCTVCVYVHMYCMYICVYVFMYVCVHTYVRMCACVSTCAHAYVCSYSSSWKLLGNYGFKKMYVRTYVHVHAMHVCINL